VAFPIPASTNRAIGAAARVSAPPRLGAVSGQCDGSAFSSRGQAL
jgi:hypothetical protein